MSPFIRCGSAARSEHHGASLRPLMILILTRTRISVGVIVPLTSGMSTSLSHLHGFAQVLRDRVRSIGLENLKRPGVADAD